jgi:nucleotide-binding universal stress UspA family protein
MSTVVVGVDGSDHARRALEWAIEEARAHGHRLEVVHATVDPHTIVPYTMEEMGMRFDVSKARTAAERLIADLLADVGVPDGLEVDAVVEQGPAANVLVRRSQDATVLVVGTRGHGAMSEVLLGSVSHQVVHHAQCPVVVVRGKG